jgi:hypothetical protein
MEATRMLIITNQLQNASYRTVPNCLPTADRKRKDKNLHNYNIITERRGRVGNTPVSYSGGPRFKSQLFWLRIFVVFLCRSMQIPG